jgi:hypothetical protein
MASDFDAAFDRVAARANLPQYELEQAKHFVMTVVLPAFESLKPELESAGRSVTVTPAIDPMRPADRDVVHSRIRVSHEDRLEIEYSVCLRLNASGVLLESESVYRLAGQRVRGVGWSDAVPRDPAFSSFRSLATLTQDHIAGDFREHYRTAVWR